VADPKGVGPTVYVGSYDGNFYAFNAQSGTVRWRHAAGGKISGSSTVIGNVVYYSDLGGRNTAGLDASTGRQVFLFPDGAFTPVIADYHAIYLDGYGAIYELLPGRAPRPRHPRRPRHPHAHPAAHRHHRRPSKRARKRRVKRHVRKAAHGRR
jgi:hypothetical protein